MNNMIEKTASAYDFPLLIKHLLTTPLATDPEQVILYRDKAKFTYSEFAGRVTRLAGGLAALGVKPGDTVAFMEWDSHRYLESYFAVPMMGAVLHTINIRLSPDQLAYTINHAEDDVLVVNGEFLPLIEAILDKLTTVKKLVLINDAPTRPESRIRFDAEYEELLAGAPAAYDFPDFDENTRATTFYTTGTTGLPKGVYFSHRQIVLHTLAGLTGLSATAMDCRFTRADVYMPITPMFHVHAWGMPYMATLMGVKQVYPGRYEPAMLLGLVIKEKVTFSHCVPTILHMLVSSPVVKQVDLSNWKVIIGGSALPRALCRAALGEGINLYTGYGMSETCPILTLSQLAPDMLDYDVDRQVEIRCKTGRPIPLVDLRIVDEEMKDVAHDGKTTGEIVVRSPWLTQGYLKDPRSSETLWRGGYLHTSDVASIDGRGYVAISDRIKDVIKTGGEWISSLEIEDIISHHPAVSETAVIGAPDDKWGERPLALVVLKKDAAPVDADELRDHVAKFSEKGIISRFGVPDRVLFVEAIDKTSVGKIDKKVLRAKYAGG